MRRPRWYTSTPAIVSFFVALDVALTALILVAIR